MRYTAFGCLCSVKFCRNVFICQHEDMFTDSHVSKPERKTRFVYILSRGRNSREKGGEKKKKIFLDCTRQASTVSPIQNLFPIPTVKLSFHLPEITYNVALGPNPYTFGSLGIGPIKARILKCVTNPTHFLTSSFQLHVTTATENRKLATFTHK